MLCLHLWYCRDRTVGKENARDGKRVDHRGSPDFPSDCLARSRGVSSDHSLATCRDYREVLSKFHVPCSSPANLGIFLGWVERVRVRVREREREREREKERSIPRWISVLFDADLHSPDVERSATFQVTAVRKLCRPSPVLWILGVSFYVLWTLRGFILSGVSLYMI